MNRSSYWNLALEGLFKTIFSTFIPIIFWAYHVSWVNGIEKWLNISEQFRPLFLSAILITLPGTLIYPLFRWSFRRAILTYEYKPKGNISLSLEKMKPRSLNISIIFNELPKISWDLIKLFHLTFTIIATPDIVLIKCPDHSNCKYYFMNNDGNLEIDVTQGIEDSTSDTSIVIPVILQSFGNAGNATLKVKGKKGPFYHLLVKMIVPNIKIKVS